MNAAAVLGLGVLGVPVGSFLNVVIDRVPDKAPAARPREGEACPPVVVARRAAPAVAAARDASGEPAASPTLALGRAGHRRGLRGASPAASASVLSVVPLLVLGASLVAVSVIDLQLLRIPDRVTFPTLAVAVPLVALVSLRYDDRRRRSLGALVGAVAYFVLLLLPHLVYPRGMGFGDVKLALVMGLYLGWLGWSEAYPGRRSRSSSSCTASCSGALLGVVFGVIVRGDHPPQGRVPVRPGAGARLPRRRVLRDGPAAV